MVCMNILLYAVTLFVLVFMHYSTLSFLASLVLFLICQVFLLFYFSPSPSEIWKQVTGHKALTFTLVLTLARAGLTLLHCFTRSSASPYAGMGMILSFLTLYGISVFYFLFREGEHSFARLFLVQAFVFGTVLNMIFPVYSIADEPQHLRTAYNLSNIFMGIKSPDDGILMRKDDAEFESRYLDYITYSTEDFDQYLTEMSQPLKDASLVTVKDEMEYSSTLDYTRRPLVFNTEWYQYTFTALGITLGRMFHANTVVTYMLGRFFNLLFYILAVYFAIRIAPVGKSLLYSIALLPMPMQLAASASRDAFQIVCAMLMIALTLRVFYHQKEDTDNPETEQVKNNDTVLLILLAASCILLLPLRNYIYSVLLLLPIGLICWRKGILNKKRLTILVAIPIVLAVGYIIFKQFIHPENIIEEPHLGLQWYSAQSYSKEYFINHPLEIISMIQHTFWLKAAWYVETTLGYWLGWLDVSYYEILVYLLIICLIVNTFRRSYEPVVLPGLFRFSSGALSVLSMLLIMVGMAVTWTEIGNTIIDGVQGRYFLPVLFPFLLSFRGPSITADERFDKAAICLQFVTTLYIVQFLLLRMFG